MGQLPGIYVEIKGDYTDLERNLKAAKALVTNQATGISNALNNALSPNKVRGSINSLVTQFGTLNRASQISGDTFGKIGVDLGKLREITSLTEEQLAKLQSQLLRTQTSNAQENALKKIASAAGLTREEIRDLGKQFDLSVAQIDKVAVSLHGAERQAKSFADRIKGIPAIKSYAPAVAPATAVLDKSMQGGEAAFVRSVVTIGDAAQASKAAFALTKAELGELGTKVGLTAEQMDTLKSRVAAMSGEMAQTNALRSLAQSAGLARDEIQTLGAQMGVSEERARGVANSIHGAEAAVKSYAEQIKGIPKIPTLTSLSTGAQAGVYSGYAGQYAAMAQDLTALTQAESLAGKAADAFANDIAELGKHAKLTDEQMQSLQERMSKAAVSSAQENALKRLASQLNLTDKELEDFGRQFGLTAAQMERIVGPAKNVERAVDGIGNAGKKKMDLFSGSIAMAAGKFLLLEQAAYSVQRILNATVFGFNSTVETASIGISAAFLNNGQYVDQITGKVLTGQQAMKAAMEDADGVIQQLRASNMVTIATLDQLIKAYQEAAPVALSKGFNKDQVEQFTVAMMQAAGAVDTTGMLIGQMGEEMRSLLNGGINPKNTRIATALGITNEDVKKYQGDIQGLFNFLMSKLAAYQAFGDQLQKTWKGVASNTVDIFQQMSAQATEPIFVAVRDGLYEWTKGIASVDQETKKLKWNPDYLSGVESVRKEVSEFISLLKAHGPSFSKNFESMSSAAGGSAKAVKEVSLAVLGIYDAGEKLAGWGAWEWGLVGYALFKGGPQAAAIVATLNTVNGLLGSMSGSNIGAIPGQFADMQSSARNFGQTLSESFSGLREWNTGDLISTDGVSVRVDQITREIGKLQTSIASMEGSNGAVGGLVASLISPVSVEEAKARIASLKNEMDDLKKTTTGSSVYQPNKNTVVSDEWNKGREKFLASLQTEREKALADYEEQKQYVKTVEEGQKLRAQLSEKLASIDSKAAKSSQAAGLKAERAALKELNAEITGYTAEAREAGNAALAWNRDAQDSLEAIQKLNNELGTSGMSDFGKMAYDSAQLVKQGTKDVEEYQLAVANAGNQIAITGAAYDKANEQLNKAKAALAANGAGSDTQDANKVRALEKEVVDLDSQLRKHTQIYYDLTEAQKSKIKTVEELQAAAKDTLAFETAMQGYQELGLITGEFYAELEKREARRRQDFVANGGDPWIAQQLEYAATLKDRTALASTEYLKNGKVGGLMGTGLENYKISVDQDAITFYSELFPNAIGESTDAMAEFFRDIAQGNASLSESWKSLGESVENTIYDILQDLLALQLKMVVLGSLGLTSSGSTTGGGLVGMLTGLFSANATGNVYSAPALSAYSNSIVSRPTVFPFAKGIGLMGEAGSEAIMPLTRTSGGKLGVQADMSGVGASAPNINVTINNNSSAQATATVQQSSDGLSYDVIVEMVEQKMQDRVNRGRQAVGKRVAYL